MERRPRLAGGGRVHAERKNGDVGNCLHGKYAFGSDYSPKGGILTEVSFPASLRLIDDYAFCYQTKLTSIHFEEGLEYIGDSAFRNCNAAGDVIVPASVKTICRSGLQLSSANRLFLRGAFKDIYAENEWNGYSFSTVKPPPTMSTAKPKRADTGTSTRTDSPNSGADRLTFGR